MDEEETTTTTTTTGIVARDQEEGMRGAGARGTGRVGGGGGEWSDKKKYTQSPSYSQLPPTPWKLILVSCFLGALL